MELQDPITLTFQQVTARLPIGLHEVDLMQEQDWTRPLERLVLTLRAKVLTHDLAPATVSFHDSHFERRKVTVEKTVERPARRRDAIRLAFGAHPETVEWATARYYDVIEVVVPVTCDHDIVIDRKVGFPEAEIRFPSKLGRAVMYEEVRER